MGNIKTYIAGFALLGLLSCVTVNIYFPEAAAEDALRGVAQDILNTQPSETTAPKPGAQLSIPHRSLIALMELLVPSVQAADKPDINVDTPVAVKLRKELKERQAELDPFYKSGAIGYSSDGQPVPRDLSLVPLNERTKLKVLLSRDSQARRAMFAEIARANGHPEWEPNLRDTFNRVFIEELPSGYWYQDAQGKWKQK